MPDDTTHTFAGGIRATAHDDLGAEFLREMVEHEAPERREETHELTRLRGVLGELRRIVGTFRCPRTDNFIVYFEGGGERIVTPQEQLAMWEAEGRAAPARP